MYLLLFIHSLYINVAAELCATPSGQLGECIPIRSCPSLLWSLANVKYGIDKYLEKFLCSNRESGLIVCCIKSSDQLLFENDEYGPGISNINDPKEITNAKGCGFTDNSVTHNEVMRLQDFPWLVKIMSVVNQDKSDSEINVGCTGVLINHLYVLFSAQCFYSLIVNGVFFVQVETYRPREKRCHETTYLPKCSYLEIYEAHCKVHPFFDYVTKLNDIAIIRLNRRVYDSEYLRPICLPISSEPLKEGQTLYVAGWNRTYNFNHVSVKQIQPTTFITNLECQKRLNKSGNSITLTPYEMCTSTEENVLDKYLIGLPLMSLHGNRWYLEGFESQGETTKVYARIQNYLQWIQKEWVEVERCFTPYNEIGEGTELGFCPKLMDAIANSHRNDVRKLLSFAGMWSTETKNRYILKVCCGLAPNFTIPPETAHKNLDFQISDFRFCGLQHRDDYTPRNDDISVDEFPWLAVIMNATLMKQRDRICGGTLITNRYVLTSGQCVRMFNRRDVKLVRLGDYNLRNVSDCVEVTELNAMDCNEVQEYGIEKQIVHPFYNYFTYLNDIALLRLSRIVTFSDYIRPICLPRSEDDIGVPGETLFSTGFGDINRNFAGPKIKKKIRMTLISIEECKEKLIFFSAAIPITPYHVCTKDFKNSTDIICEGDAGGPVMLSKRSRWFIVGVASNYACGDNKPQTHLNVYKYMKWIKLNIEN